MKEQLIFLHGLFGDEKEFSKDHLSLTSNIESIFLKLPDANENFPEYVKRLHHLLTEKNAEKKHLLGFSMGGRISFHLKAMYPECYDKVILLGAQAINFEDDSRLELDQNRLTSIKNETEFTTWTKNFFNAPLYGHLYGHPHFQEKKAKIKFSNINRYQQFFDFLSVSRQPTLTTLEIRNLKNIFYLYGEHDHKYKEIGKKLKKIISGLQTFSIPDAHHAAHIENPIGFGEVVQKIFHEEQ